VTLLANLSIDLEFHQPKNSISAEDLISGMADLQLLGSRQNYGVMQVSHDLIGAFALSSTGKFKVVDLFKVQTTPVLSPHNRIKVTPKRSSSFADFDTILIVKDL